MGPISNVDALVLLLRQRLSERSKAAERGRPAERQRPRLGMDAVHALAAIEGVDDRQLKRALIQNLLAERFGSHLINDANFQQIVERVSAAIEGEAEASRLLSRVAQDLRASAR